MRTWVELGHRTSDKRIHYHGHKETEKGEVRTKHIIHTVKQEQRKRGDIVGRERERERERERNFRQI